MVAWALLALSVLWGLALSTKALAAGPAELDPRPAPLPRRPGLIFTGVRLAIMADSYVHFGLEVLVPFAGTCIRGPGHHRLYSRWRWRSRPVAPAPLRACAPPIPQLPLFALTTVHAGRRHRPHLPPRRSSAPPWP
jgi:hypothetical protein